MTKIWTKDELVAFLSTNIKDAEELNIAARRWFHTSRIKSKPLYTIFDLVGKQNYSKISKVLNGARFNKSSVEHIDSFLENLGLSRNMHGHRYDPAVSRKIITGEGDVDATSTLKAIEEFAAEFVANQANNQTLRSELKAFLLADIMDETHGIKIADKDLESATLGQLMDMRIELNLQLLFHYGCDVRQNTLDVMAIKTLNNHLAPYGLKLGDLKRDSFKTPFTTDTSNADALAEEVLDRILGKPQPKAEMPPIGLPTEEDFRSLAEADAEGKIPSAEVTPAADLAPKTSNRDELIAFLNSKPSAHDELSTRIKNCLRNDNVNTMFEVIKLTDSELLRMPDFGRKSLNELKEFLSDHGLKTGVDAEGLSVEEFVDQFLGTQTAAASLPKVATAFHQAALLTADDYDTLGKSLNDLIHVGPFIEQGHLQELLTREDIKIQLNDTLAKALNLAVQHVAAYLSAEHLEEVLPAKDVPEEEMGGHCRFEEFFFAKLSQRLSTLESAFIKALAHDSDKITDITVSCYNDMQSSLARAVANDLKASLE